jgi:hypothetical protein
MWLQPLTRQDRPARSAFLSRCLYREPASFASSTSSASCSTSPREAHPCNPARTCYPDHVMSRERKINAGRKRQAGKTGEPSVQLRTPLSPASLLPAANPSFLRRVSLDTLGRTESHPSDSKQTIGVTLTRHSYEGALHAVSHAHSATKLPPWFYAVRCHPEERSDEGSASLASQGASAVTGRSKGRVLTFSGAFPIIARRLLHRPFLRQPKEPRV